MASINSKIEYDAVSDRKTRSPIFVKIVFTFPQQKREIPQWPPNYSMRNHLEVRLILKNTDRHGCMFLKLVQVIQA